MVLEKLLITRINHHPNKNGLLANSQYGFTLQKSTTDAVMEAKKYIEPELETRKIVIMTSQMSQAPSMRRGGLAF